MRTLTRSQKHCHCVGTSRTESGRLRILGALTVLVVRHGPILQHAGEDVNRYRVLTIVSTPGGCLPEQAPD